MILVFSLVEILLFILLQRISAELNSTLNIDKAIDEGDTSNTCPIIILLAFTDNGKVNKKNLVEFPFSLMSGALMAINDFNARDGSVVRELASPEFAFGKGCNVTIPVRKGWTIKDDGDTEGSTAKALLDATINSVSHVTDVDKIEESCREMVQAYRLKIQNFKICGVVAPFNPEPAYAASMMTAALNVTFLSYGQADWTGYGKNHLRPLTAKITADEYKRGDEMADYIVNFRKRDYIILIHTSDVGDNGGPPKVLDKAFKKCNAKFEKLAWSPMAKSAEPTNVLFVMNRVKELGKSGYRSIILVTSRPNHWLLMYDASIKAQLNLAEYVWYSYDTIPKETLKAYSENVGMNRFLQGMGTMSILDGFAYKSEDLFLQHWKRQNATLISELNRMNPIKRKDNNTPGYFFAEDDYFETHDPRPYTSFIYDSVIALSMAKCRAKETFPNRNLQIVKEIPDHDTYKELVNITFEGASGHVNLGSLDSGFSRNPESIAFGMYNTQLNNNGELVYVLTEVKKPYEKHWTALQPWEYNDGTTKEPSSGPRFNTAEWPVWIFFVVILPYVAGISFFAYYYVEYNSKLVDSVWKVKPSELIFDDPAEVIGRGTFGMVLLAEYRGTKVAVKRVIPPKITKRYEAANDEHDFKYTSIKNVFGTFLTSDMSTSSIVLRDLRRFDFDANSSTNEPRQSQISVQTFLPGEASVLETTSSSFGVNIFKSIKRRTRGMNSFGNKSKYSIQKEDFVSEMRLLSKLRHPRIITVMGAVMNKYVEPMLVMEFMNHGSLFDLLHNGTVILDGNLILPILQDISNGIRFLHSATPQMIHGDLKAQNVLVDDKFRAKVADFGLSQKKKLGSRGTPYWMAPELLRGESENNVKTDVYAFGILLYELYSRRLPYEGEDFQQVLKEVADPLFQKRPPVPPSCPSHIQSLMADCLLDEISYRHRPSFDEIDGRIKRVSTSNIEPDVMLPTKQFKKTSILMRGEQMADQLLFHIFPCHIAEALKHGRKVEPEHRDVVTIFFSDIIGFTNISSSLPAIKISNMLDRLYNEFDALSLAHDIFKVETIGDAYMAVTNLVQDQEDHTKQIAHFAIDALKAANETLIDVEDPSKGFISIRVGFHSGPVVASVVGTMNPRYCLFGDTVNTASRMESNSQKDRIQCSERAAKLLIKQCPELCIKCRGAIRIKGKGDMVTYWVNEKDSEK